MKHKLAIVIPAYKSLFFRQTLESLANQTCKDFTLYIGDDASADPLETIVNTYSGLINTVYHRFETNLGSVSLVKHWKRCIDLTDDEKYIWLFSDDDLLANDAVERFFRAADQFPEYDLYRFNMQIIDENNKKISRATGYRGLESVESFVQNRLLGEINSSVVEYIFTRDIYTKTGGFVEFPLAWASDDATWVKFGSQNGIYCIEGSLIYWRISGNNISSLNNYNCIKYESMLLFFNWLKDNSAGITGINSHILFALNRQVRILNISPFVYLTHIRKTINAVGPFNSVRVFIYSVKIFIRKSVLNG